MKPFGGGWIATAWSARIATVWRVRIAAVCGAVLVIAASIVVGGCGVGTGPSIVLYNGQHPQLTSALVAAFERENRIRVRVRTDDSIVLASQILQEGSGTGADVYLAENSPELTTLEEHRELARLPQSTLGQVPARYSSPHGDWMAVALRVGALAYAPGLIGQDQLPASVLALAEPGWKGRVAIAPTDSDFVPLVSALVAAHGQAAASQWLAGLKRNAQIYQTDESVVAALNRSDVAMGLVNSYYWYRLRLQVGPRAMHSALHYFPGRDVGSVQNISGAAVLAASSHKRGAQAFVRFLASRPAQLLIAQGDDFEYPARRGVAPNSALPQLSAIDPATPSPAALGDGQLAARLIRRSGLV